MGRPYGLLRAGFPFHKALGMRRLTNFPIDLAIGQEDRLYILCRSEGTALIRRYSTEDKDLGNFGKLRQRAGRDDLAGHDPCRQRRESLPHR